MERLRDKRRKLDVFGEPLWMVCLHGHRSVYYYAMGFVDNQYCEVRVCSLKTVIYLDVH